MDVGNLNWEKWGHYYTVKLSGKQSYKYSRRTYGAREPQRIVARYYPNLRKLKIEKTIGQSSKTYSDVDFELASDITFNLIKKHEKLFEIQDKQKSKSYKRHERLNDIL